MSNRYRRNSALVVPITCVIMALVIFVGCKVFFRGQGYEDPDKQTETTVANVTEATEATTETEAVTATETTQAQSTGSGIEPATQATKAAKKDSDAIIVCLDAGHDVFHAGASATYNGVLYREEQITMKIAKACRDELDKYAGVIVYMTHEEDMTSSTCPLVGNNANSGDCAAQRVNYASSVDADYLVSFHIDALDQTNYYGASIYYPNTNYDSSLSAKGKVMATDIMSQLVTLGIDNNGVKTKDASSSYYADGSLGDYYAIVRYAKRVGICGMIVEHGYISNESDVMNFFSTDEKCKQVGIADANGIAEALNLK